MRTRIIGVFLLLLVIIPGVASAAWWNPFSWFDFIISRVKEDKNEVLEKKIEALETELNKVSESKSSEPIQGEQKDQRQNSGEVLRVKEPKIPQVVVPNPSNTVNNGVSYESVLSDYKSFKLEITSALEQMRLSRLQSPSYEEKYNYTQKFLADLNYELRVLENLPSDQKIAKTFDSYKNKLVLLKAGFKGRMSDFEIQHSAYIKTKEQESVKEADLAKLNSPECKTWTFALESIDSEIKPIKGKLDKFRDDYLLSGIYNTSEEKSSLTSKYTDLIVRRSGLEVNYFQACLDHYPTPDYLIITNCYTTGSRTSCYSY